MKKMKKFTCHYCKKASEKIKYITYNYCPYCGKKAYSSSKDKKS